MNKEQVKMAQKTLFNLAQSLLDDDYGISEKSFNNLAKLIKLMNISLKELNNVRAADGRFYFPDRTHPYIKEWFRNNRIGD